MHLEFDHIDSGFIEMKVAISRKFISKGSGIDLDAAMTFWSFLTENLARVAKLDIIWELQGDTICYVGRILSRRSVTQLKLFDAELDFFFKA